MAPRREGSLAQVHLVATSQSCSIHHGRAGNKSGGRAARTAGNAARYLSDPGATVRFAEEPNQRRYVSGPSSYRPKDKGQAGGHYVPEGQSRGDYGAVALYPLSRRHGRVVRREG